MIYYVLFMHWLGDFVLQREKWAVNKYKDWNMLWLHICTYYIVMFCAMWPIIGKYDAVTFATINALAHFVTDAITSRISHYAYERKQMKLFWSTIGFDQFLHVAVLCATLSSMQ